MNPPDAHSSLAALRQLKEMLDAGTITPDEFETLKRQLIFGQEPALPLDPPAAAPTSEAASAPTPEAPAPLPETTQAAYETAAPNPAEFAPLPPAATPDWSTAPGPSALPAEESEPESAPAGERANPLNLLFAIGGTLVFLGAVFYLMLGRPDAPDEHLTTGSQTAADSTVVLPETGPQAEQLNLPPVAPETVRVAPITRPTPAAGQFQADSAVAAPAPAAPVPKAPAPATALPALPDTAATKVP